MVPRMNSQSGRATPLPRDERRAAILDAVIPLLIENGASVTTAEMAEAAGIAEGTIFRAFPDKAALLHDAIKATMDPAPIRQALSEIDPDSPFEEQVAAATEALGNQFERIAALMGMLRSMPQRTDQSARGSHKLATDSMAAISAALTEVMARHRDKLLIDPANAAVVLRGLAFTNAHPHLSSDRKMSTQELVGILLNGILARDNA